MKALITGASSGIGRDMARCLANKGYDLVLVARDEEKLNQLSKELKENNKIKVKVMSMDLSVEENCKELHKCVPYVDILINNAGFGDCGNFTKTDLNKELRMIKTNIVAKDITVVYKSDKYIDISLKDSEGNPVTGVNILININGETTILSVDNIGKTSYSTDYLKPKAYTATITFNGNKKYHKSTATIKVTVKKATPKLTAKAKTFKKSVKTKKYTVTLKTNQNKVMKNTKLTLKVNKKTYTATTNSKGQATFKITKLIKKGTFKATITYNGSAYYNKVTKNINIKCK